MTYNMIFSARASEFEKFIVFGVFSHCGKTPKQEDTN